MKKPKAKDSRHSVKYVGNQLMIEKIADCVESANAPRKGMRERASGLEAITSAHEKRLRKQAKRARSAS